MAMRAHCCLLASFLTRVSGLLGDVFTLTSPTSRTTAAQLASDVKPNIGHEHWCCVFEATSAGVDITSLPTEQPAYMPLGAPRMPLGRKPLAVGRLSREKSPPTVDCLRCSLPKEDETHAVAIGLCLDALLLAWAEHLARTETPSQFETLHASSSIATEAILTSRGFVELDNVDFGALGRGETVLTHTARLPNALFGAKARGAKPGLNPLDQEHVAAMVEAFSALEPPAPSERIATTSAPIKDPWAGLKGFGAPL